MTSTLVRSVAASGVLFLALLVFANVVFHDPAVVERVSVENRSGYDIHIEVAGDDRGGSLPLGVALQHCTTAFDLVIDQGSTWRVSFRSQGVDAGQITVPRDELRSADWTIQIPDAVGAGLTEQQVPLPPVQTCS